MSDETTQRRIEVLTGRCSRKDAERAMVVMRESLLPILGADVSLRVSPALAELADAEGVEQIAQRYRALAWEQAMTLLDERSVPRKVKWTGAEMTLGLADRIRLLADPDLDLAGGRPVGVEGEAEAVPDPEAKR